MRAGGRLLARFALGLPAQRFSLTRTRQASLALERCAVDQGRAGNRRRCITVLARPRRDGVDAALCSTKGGVQSLKADLERATPSLAPLTAIARRSGKVLTLWRQSARVASNGMGLVRA
jgi:hypothetical protein